MNINVNDIISKERKIGQQYARRLRDSVKQQLSILDKRTGTTSKVGYRVRFRNYELQSISAKTIKSAFINHHGVDKQRRRHPFKSRTGNTFMRKEHPFKLTPKVKMLGIPDDIVNGLADDIADLRGDEVLMVANKMLNVK